MEYTEEEKKAIKDFKEDTRNAKIYKFQKRCEVNIKILDLLEKQQKEIEKLEEHLNQYYDGKLFTANQLKATEKEQNKYYIHKDKIREKIKDLRYNESLGFEQSFEETFKIEVLEELLGDE